MKETWTIWKIVLNSFLAPQNDMAAIVQSASTRMEMVYMERFHVCTKEEESKLAEEKVNKDATDMFEPVSLNEIEGDM